jgi:drug/metabolite transporter (DMT)-like permease
MRAEFYLILTAIFWGVNFYFAQLMLSESSVVEAATWRYIFGVGTLLIIGWNSLRKIRLQDISIKGVVLLGFIGLFAFNVLFFKGMQLTNAINASLLVNLNPIMTVLFASWLIGVKITRYHIIGATISIIGVAYLLFQGDWTQLQTLQFNRGDLYIFGGAVIFALHNVWVKMYQGNLSSLNFTTLTNIACLTGFLLFMTVQPVSLSVSHSPEYWIWSLGIGTLGTALAYFFFNKGVAMIGPDRASMFLNLVPLTTVVAGIVLGRPLHAYHIVSGLIILTGVTIAQRAKPAA